MPNGLANDTGLLAALLLLTIGFFLCHWSDQRFFDSIWARIALASNAVLTIIIATGFADRSNAVWREAAAMALILSLTLLGRQWIGRDSHD